MDSRTRLLTALDGGEPDRVPCALAFYHVDGRSLAPRGAWREDWVDVDFVRVPPSPEEQRLERAAAVYDGDTRLGTSSQAATYALWRYRPQDPPRSNPLAEAQSLEDLESFAFPPIRGPYHVRSLSRQVESLHARGLAVGGNLPHLGGELFEAAWRLRGLENFLLDLLERPAWAHSLVARLAEHARRNARAVTESGIDFLALDDDVGMPGTMMIGPVMWREFFRDPMARIIGAAREVNPELRVLYHSDGSFEPILDDLVEIGVNAVNPLQPEAMDAQRIRSRFGPRLALWGTVGRQATFSGATPEEIREEVRRRVETLGRAGLILSPAYDIDEPDIPWENIAAFLEAARAFGGSRG
jgi:uroporphyrinogen decarboxylase